MTRFNPHDGLFGHIEQILTTMSPKIVKQIQGHHTKPLPTPLQRQLSHARNEQPNWFHPDDIDWLTRAVARHHLTNQRTHQPTSIAHTAAELNIAPRIAERLFNATTQTVRRATINIILAAANRAEHTICLAQLAADLTSLRANRTQTHSGLTRAQIVTKIWRDTYTNNTIGDTDDTS